MRVSTNNLNWWAEFLNHQQYLRLLAEQQKHIQLLQVVTCGLIPQTKLVTSPKRRLNSKVTYGSFFEVTLLETNIAVFERRWSCERLGQQSGNWKLVEVMTENVIGVMFFKCLCFSRKTFRRRVLQKIVGVSHTTHIPHISHTTHIPHISITPHISHTYPTHIHSKRIPPIRIPPIRIRSTRIPPVRIHAMRIHSKRLHQQVLQYVSHQYVSHQYVSHQHVSHQYVSMLCVSIQCVSIQKVCISRNRKTYPTNTYPTNTYLQHVSHQYGSIQCVSIQKVCISRNGNEYEYHCISFHTIATRREW